MCYVIGIDGGGTKTEGILCNDSGDVRAFCSGGPSNHQYLPKQTVYQNIKNVVECLFRESGIRRKEVAGVFLGLAGADSPQDHQMLTELLKPLFKEIPYTVKNDIWSAMAAVPEVTWGAIAICGTGFNMALRMPDGKEVTLRALEYEHGNLSATEQLGKDALHAAFCSEEHTGPKSILEEEIPKAIGESSMAEVLERMQEDPALCKDGRLVKVLFCCAREGDFAAQEILIRFGESAGKMLGSFLKYAGLSGTPVPIVLSGSVFVKGESQLCLDAMRLALRRFVPEFTFFLNSSPPAVGSCLEAFRRAGLRLEKAVYQKFLKEVEEFPLVKV